MPAAWLSLDKDDNNATRFLRYMVASLHAADDKVGSEAAQLLAEPGQVSVEGVVVSVLNDLDRANREMALVLDDYHIISDQSVHRAVAFFMEHLPGTFHLLITSRSDPPLHIARLRARGQMLELRAADLSFSKSEAAEFLNNVMGLHLDERSVEALEERTEGWIAGLQMAALSMRDRKDIQGFIDGFSGTNRYIMDFLLEEVLASQTPEIQRFLLSTSILERLNAPLCDAVLIDGDKVNRVGDERSAAILAYLEQANLFLVPLDDERTWYRYHHLFADLLRARLYQSEPDRVARLFSRAAEWCEMEGQIADAVDYALVARDYRRASGLIARHWHNKANDGEIETVWSWLKALPEDEIKNNALLGLAFCWILWFNGQVGEIRRHLEDAETALVEEVRSEGFPLEDEIYADLPAHLAVLHSIVARLEGDSEAAFVHAEQALHLAPEGLSPQANAQLRTVIFSAQALAYEGAGNFEKAVGAYKEAAWWSRSGVNAAGVAGMTHWMIGALWALGRLREADEVCRDGLMFLEEQGLACLPAAGILHIRMSELLLERNHLDEAEEHLSRGIELGQRSGRFDAVQNAAPALARLKRVRGDTEGALAAVKEAVSALGEAPSPLTKAGLLALMATILARQRAVNKAVQCIKEAESLAGRDRGQVGEKTTLAAFRVTLALGRIDDTIAGLTDSLSAAEKSGRLGSALEMRLLRSLALERRGDIPAAMPDIERALALAEPEGYTRIFLDEGRPMQMLIALWLAAAAPGPSRDFAVHLLSCFKAEEETAAPVQKTGSPPGALVEPLSPRELEVLSLMSLGSTNQEIARQLFVSPGTVKAHTASIYRKLGVANRTEAAAHARKLGIIP